MASKNYYNIESKYGESLLKDYGWKHVGGSAYEKKNRNRYVFRVFLDKDTEEWWCHIDDERHRSCGIVYIPSYSTLEALFRFYGQ